MALQLFTAIVAFAYFGVDCEQSVWKVTLHGAVMWAHILREFLAPKSIL